VREDAASLLREDAASLLREDAAAQHGMMLLRSTG